jgi:hypothetical protein
MGRLCLGGRHAGFILAFLELMQKLVQNVRLLFGSVYDVLEYQNCRLPRNRHGTVSRLEM